jgi:hypothetical protein
MVVHRFGSVLRLAAVAALCTACSGTPTGPSPGASSTPTWPGDLVGTAVKSFSVVEFSEGGKWFYTPKLRITAGPASVAVTRVRVTIPGVDPAREVCGVFVIQPATTKDLFQGFYGEYEVVFDAEKRSPGGMATAVIEFRDDMSEASTLSVDGPIVPGDGEAGYSAGIGSWRSCS